MEEDNKEQNDRDEETLEPEEDFVVEEDEGGDGEDNIARQAERKIKKMREELKACQTEKQDYVESLQRMRADYVNMKKSYEEEKSNLIKFANEDLLNEMLALEDSFTMAFGNKEAWESVPENWRKGVEYIYSQLTYIFKNNGMEEVKALGETFDPMLHHSAGTVETEKEEEEGKVLVVIKRGFKLNGKLLRPATVKVGEFKK